MLSEITAKREPRNARGTSFSTANTALATGHDTWRKAASPNRWWHSPSTGARE